MSRLVLLASSTVFAGCVTFNLADDTGYTVGATTPFSISARTHDRGEYQICVARVGIDDEVTRVECASSARSTVISCVRWVKIGYSITQVQLTGDACQETRVCTKKRPCREKWLRQTLDDLE